MNLPTRSEIEQLHRKYAKNDEEFKSVWQHCLIVERIALEIIDDKKLEANKELVSVGALLHDIGVYDVYDSDRTVYIRHGVIGYEILKKEGMSEVICRFASHHTGLGLTKDEIIANKLNLPHEDFEAETLEEELVMYSDKFHSKTPDFINSVKWYKGHIGVFWPKNLVIFEEFIEKFGVPDLELLAKEYGLTIR